MTIDTYLEQVLAYLPPTTPLRQQITLELRGHIQERLDAGEPLEQVLRQLGNPRVLAESYLSGIPLVPAPFGPRVMAKLIDLLVVLALVALIGLVAWLSPRGPWTVALLWAMVLAGGFGFIGYTIAAEYRRGQTLGKRVYGLWVVQESGAPISLGQSVVRQLSMAFQIFWIDALFALFTERRQRAFELLSKTLVVQAGNRSQ